MCFKVLRWLASLFQLQQTPYSQSVTIKSVNTVRPARISRYADVLVVNRIIIQTALNQSIWISLYIGKSHSIREKRKKNKN